MGTAPLKSKISRESVVVLDHPFSQLQAGRLSEPIGRLKQI